MNRVNIGSRRREYLSRRRRLRRRGRETSCVRIVPPAGARSKILEFAACISRYQLLEGYDLLILIDALQRGEQPGNCLRVRARSSMQNPSIRYGRARMDPARRSSMPRTLGGRVGRVLVVGCEPRNSSNESGLASVVSRAVDEAVARAETH